VDSPQVARWQRLLDREFPKGAVCEWVKHAGTDNGPTYKTPRIEVTGMAGLDPVIRLPIFGPEKVIGPVRCLSYTVTQRSPSVQARVELEGMPAMFWSSGVGPILARAMDSERRELADRAPLGGLAAVS
jgi:hypothetical protein